MKTIWFGDWTTRSRFKDLRNKTFMAIFIEKVLRIYFSEACSILLITGTQLKIGQDFIDNLVSGD